MFLFRLKNDMVLCEFCRARESRLWMRYIETTKAAGEWNGLRDERKAAFGNDSFRVAFLVPTVLFACAVSRG